MITIRGDYILDLLQLTKQLKLHLDQLKQIYEENKPPESRKDKAFFLYVKENTTPIYKQLAEWESNTLQMVKDRQVNLHPHQVASTRENYELLLMHSYYIDVRRKRYMELNHSIHYIFDQLIRDLS